MEDSKNYLVTVDANGKKKNILCESETEMFENVQAAISSGYNYKVYKAKLEKVLDSENVSGK